LLLVYGPENRRTEEVLVVTCKTRCLCHAATAIRHLDLPSHGATLPLELVATPASEMVGDDQMIKKKRGGIASGCISLTWTSKFRLYIFIFMKKKPCFLKRKEKKSNE